MDETGVAEGDATTSISGTDDERQHPAEGQACGVIDPADGGAASSTAYGHDLIRHYLRGCLEACFLVGGEGQPI